MENLEKVKEEEEAAAAKAAAAAEAAKKSSGLKSELIFNMMGEYFNRGEGAKVVQAV